MKQEIGLAKTLFTKKKEYFLVINNEYYIRINRTRYYDLFKYLKLENKNEIH